MVNKKMFNNEDELENSKTAQEKFDIDIKYIQNSIMTQQPNGNYMKFSTILNAVTVMNVTRESYINYWSNKYKNEPEYQSAIIEECNNKLATGLLPLDGMIHKIKTSKDYTKEKVKALAYLRGEEQ